MPKIAEFTLYIGIGLLIFAFLFLLTWKNLGPYTENELTWKDLDPYTEATFSFTSNGVCQKSIFIERDGQIIMEALKPKLFCDIFPVKDENGLYYETELCDTIYPDYKIFVEIFDKTKFKSNEYGTKAFYINSKGEKMYLVDFSEVHSIANTINFKCD